MPKKRILLNNIVQRRYTFKIYPNSTQLKELDQQRIMAAQLWNALLQIRSDAYRLKRLTLTALDLSSQIKDLRRECPEWAVPASTMLHKVNENLDLAFNAFFTRAKQGKGHDAGYPRFKGIKRADSIPFRHMENSGWKLSQKQGNNWLLYVKGVSGVLKLRGQIPDDPLSIRTMDLKFICDCWYMSVCVEIPKRSTQTPKQAPSSIHFDLFDKTASIMDRPELSLNLTDKTTDLENQRSKLQIDRDTRLVRGSYRYREKTKQIAKLSRKMALVRNDILHKWTTNVVKNSSSIEAHIPKLKENLKSGRGDEKFHGGSVETVAKLNQHFLNQAPGKCAQMLCYKSDEAGISYTENVVEESVLDISQTLVQAAISARRVGRRLKRLENGKEVKERNQSDA